MTRKKPELPTGAKHEPTNGLLATVESIFASNINESTEGGHLANELGDVIKFIGDRFIELLGTSRDYEICYSEPESIGGGLSYKGIMVMGKAVYDGSRLPKIIRDTRQFLFASNLTIDEGTHIIDTIIDRVEKECAVEYQFANDVAQRIDTGNHIVQTSEIDIVSGIYKRFPAEVELVLGDLEGCGMDFVYYEMKRDIESLDLADKVIKIEGLMDDCWLDKKPYYHSALNALLGDSRKAIESRTKAKEIRAAIGESDSEDLSRALAVKPNDTKASYDDELDKKRRFEGKLEYKQIMVLLSEFISEFCDADNTKKGKFIAAISPYQAEKRISDDFSYINNFAPEHSEIVKYWRNELKRTRRGRPRSNKYQKRGK